MKNIIAAFAVMIGVSFAPVAAMAHDTGKTHHHSCHHHHHHHHYHS